MNSETYLDFCFIREATGNFTDEINELLTNLFKGIRLNWYLEEKTEEGIEIVIAEVKGMSRWQSEDEVVDYIETHAEEGFWSYLQGYKMFIYPAKRGAAAVELTEIKSLESFISENVEVSILDEDGDDKAPFVKKEIIKAELCPDGTHLRIYFDRLQFFAVPLTAEVAISDDIWSAFDPQAGLTYVVKKGSGHSG